MARKKSFEPADVVRPLGEDLPDIIQKDASFYYLDNKGIRLRVMLAKTRAEDPRGTILFCPGRTEFIEKYFETIEDLLGRGFHVLMIDLRGQGLSDRMLADPLKGYVRNFRDYTEDLAFVVESFVDDLPKPHILMGHSMGGCIALLSVVSGQLNPSAVVCASPMLGIFEVETGITAWFIKIFSSVGFSKRNLPFQNQNRGMPVPFKHNKLTSDETRFRIWAKYFETTPELRVAGPTFAWASHAMKAMRFVNRNAAELKIPGLIVAAGGDPIVDPAACRDFAEAANLNFKIVPGALHELFMERDELRDQFFTAFDDFLEQEGL